MPLAALGPILLGGVGTSAAATAGAWGAIGAGAKIGADIYGAHKQASAATDAAKLQTDATKYGADKLDAAAQRAEAFQRQQAENAWQNAQSTQQANYNQAKARFGTIAGVGAQYGLPGMTMPDYVPGIDPRYTDASTPLPSQSTTPNTAGTVAGGAPSGIDWNAPPPQLASSLSAFFKSKGVADSEVPYWVEKAPELVARGKELNDPEYANKRLAAANVFGGGAGTVGGGQAPMPSAAPSGFPTVTPNTGIPTPYQPGTIRARRSY